MSLTRIEALMVKEKILEYFKDSPGWEGLSIGFGYTDERRTKTGVAISFLTKQPPERLTQIKTVAREVLGRELGDDDFKIEVKGRAFACTQGGMER